MSYHQVGAMMSINLKTFLQNHGRFVALSGLFVVFATYVVKEGFLDRFKEVRDSIETANRSFEMHDEFRMLDARLPELSYETGILVFKQEEAERRKQEHTERRQHRKPSQTYGVLSPQDAREAEMMPRLESLDHTLHTAEELTRTLPSDPGIQTALDKVRNALTNTSQECLNEEKLTAHIFDPDREHGAKEYDELLESCYVASYDREHEMSDFENQLLRYAGQVREKYDNRVKRLRVASWILYALGWIITFLGRKYDLKDSEAIP
jgi:hypothetical protein